MHAYTDRISSTRMKRRGLRASTKEPEEKIKNKKGYCMYRSSITTCKSLTPILDDMLKCRYPGKDLSKLIANVLCSIA